MQDEQIFNDYHFALKNNFLLKNKALQFYSTVEISGLLNLVVDKGNNKETGVKLLL